MASDKTHGGEFAGSEAVPFAKGSSLEIILDSVADGIFTVDLEWRITSFNRAAEKITGFSREEAIGQPCCNVFRASICQKNCALRETLKTGEQIVDRKINILNRKGVLMPVSISTAVLRDKKGEIIGGVETFRDLSPMEELKKQLTESYTFEDIVSKNREMLKIFALLPHIADSDSNVVIQGPSGCGKELIARAIHNLSPRRKAPYVAVNCGALPDTLLESELFGYVKGAFTNAHRDKPGRFAVAEGGTIFLDEIGDVSPAFQVKLLRVIQEREYEPLGAVQPVKCNVRIIAATNKDLYQLMQQGLFREDLYYRLNVVKIEVPGLRERREDIPLLVEHFIRRFNLRKGKNISSISPAALRYLMDYDFPGNVRELENIIEYAFVVCQGEEIFPEHLPREIVERSPDGKKTAEDENGEQGRWQNKEGKDKKRLAEYEREAILEALRRYQGNRGRAAAALGISRSTLWRKLKRYRASENIFWQRLPDEGIDY